jgi:uncharacterized membrane protein (UPF0127 family)
VGSSTALNLIRASRLALACCLLGSAASAQACSQDRVLVKGDFGEAQFVIELADEPAERGRGLMNRESMARSAGMLFVFEHPQAVAFWMKNTLIPLDMVFTDRAGRIVHIHENAIPLDETPIPGGEGVYAVLEINGGLSTMFGIKVGDALQHPAFSGGPAVFPCKE